MSVIMKFVLILTDIDLQDLFHKSLPKILKNPLKTTPNTKVKKNKLFINLKNKNI